MHDTKQLMTVAEVAWLLRLSTSSVTRMVKRGRLRAIRPSGAARGELRIIRQSVDELLQESAAA